MSGQTKLVVGLAGVILLLAGVFAGILLSGSQADTAGGSVATAPSASDVAIPTTSSASTGPAAASATTTAASTSTAADTSTSAAASTSTAGVTSTTTAATTTTTIVLLVSTVDSGGPLMVMPGQMVDLDTAQMYLPFVRGTIDPSTTDFMLTNIFTIVGPPNTTAALLTPINGATAVMVPGNAGCNETTAGFSDAEVSDLAIEIGGDPASQDVACFSTNEGNYSGVVFWGPSDPYAAFVIVTAAPPGFPGQ